MRTPLRIRRRSLYLKVRITSASKVCSATRASEVIEIVDLFQEYDRSGDGEINCDELFDMMRALEMDHSVDKAAELMKEIDADGSGQLDFGEFCALLAKVKRGDVEMHGFAKLTEDIGATPVAVLVGAAREKKSTSTST